MPLTFALSKTLKALLMKKHRNKTKRLVKKGTIAAVPFCSTIEDVMLFVNLVIGTRQMRNACGAA